MSQQDYGCTACGKPWITHCTLAGFAADGTPQFICGQPRTIPDPGVKRLVDLFMSADDAIAPVAIAEARTRQVEAERDAAQSALNAKNAELQQLAEQHAAEMSRTEALHASQLELRDSVARMAKATTDKLIRENAILRKDMDDFASKTLADLAADLGGPIGPDQADSLSDLKVTVSDPAATTEPPQDAAREECHWCNVQPKWQVTYVDRENDNTYILACDLEMHADDLKVHLAENAERPDEYESAPYPHPIPQLTANPQEEAHA